MNSGSFSNLKQLNDSGIQRICRDKSRTNKSNVFVCGTEGVVQKFNKASLLGDEQPELLNVGDSTTGAIVWLDNSICFGYSKTDFVVGTEKKSLGSVVNENFDDIVDVLDFQFDVTVVDMNNDYFIAGSSDFIIKRVGRNDRTMDIIRYTLEAEPISIKIDPTNKYVAVAAIDGIVSILDIDNFTLIKNFTSVFPHFSSIEVSNPLINMSWSTDGTLLYVPAKGCVKVININSLNYGNNFTHEDNSTIFSYSAISPCGSYLAVSTMDNSIVIWDTSSRSVISRSSYKSQNSTKIMSIEFSPFSNDIIVADSNKGICLLQNALNEIISTNPPTLSNVDANMEEDDDDSIVLSRSKHDQVRLANEEDDYSRLSDDIGAIKKKYGFDEEVQGLEEYGFTSKPIEEMQIDAEVNKEDNLDINTATIDSLSYNTKRKTIPSRFSTNSSPLELNERYLKYNKYGFVRSLVEESTKTNIVEFSFHDKTVHGDKVIDNFEHEYCIADISPKVVILASMESKRKEKILDKLASDDSSEEKKGTSVVYVHPISFYHAQEWTVTLPRGDGAIDVLASNEFVVILTKKRNIRVFSLTGTQRQIFCHPGPILTASCFNNKLIIASVCGSEYYEDSYKKQPQWRFEIFEYELDCNNWYRTPILNNSNGIVRRIDVPVNPCETLEWIGYSSAGKISVMDSSFDVYVLASPGVWLPIFNGRNCLRAEDDGIFPLSVVETDSLKEFRYIYCKGSKYPVYHGINAPTTVEWQIPFCQPTLDRTKNERELIMNEISQSDEILNGNTAKLEQLEKHHLVALTKLFAFAIKSNSDGRAVELANMLTSTKGVQLFVNYATKNKKFTLADKIVEIGQEIVESNKKSVVSGISHVKRSCVKETSLTQELRPRSVGLRKENIKAGSSNKYSLEESSYSLTNEEVPETLDYDAEPEPESQSTFACLDESMTIVQKNPFKKTTAIRTNVSVFDQLEQTTERKRPITDTSSNNQPQRKQVKLKFDSNQSKPSTSNEESKENVQRSITPYDMWLKESCNDLKMEYNGNDEDFSKFCIQKFRALSKAEKDSWKAKARDVKN